MRGNLLFWLAAAVLAAGCGSPLPAPDFRAANEMARISDRSDLAVDPMIFNETKNEISLFGAANETLGFQLVADGPKEGLHDARIALSDLGSRDKNVIGASNLKAFRCLGVKVKDYPVWLLRMSGEAPRPAVYYDAMVPLDANSAFDASEGERLVLWIDVHVPRAAAAGKYSGTVRVSSQGRLDWQANVSVQVYDFVLPDSRPMATLGAFSHAAVFGELLGGREQPSVPERLDPLNPHVREGLTRMRELMWLSHAHRLDLFDRDIHPLVQRDSFGKLHLDWSDYDEIVQPYLSGKAFDDSVGCPAWPSPVCENWPDPANYGGADSPAYQDMMGGLFSAAQAHFQALDAARQIFTWPCRSAPDAQAYQRQMRLAALAAKADPNTPILCSLPLNPPRQSSLSVPQGLAAMSDILAPEGQWFDPASAKLARPARGPLAGLWSAPGDQPYVPSLGVMASAADIRAIPWLAMKYNSSGLLLPEVLGGPTQLFYPGSMAGVEQVLPSARLKRLRRGIQDAEYLWLLRERKLNAVAGGVIDSVVHYAGVEAAGDNYLDPRPEGWSQDPNTWELARRILAEELQAAVHPEKATEAADRKILREQLDSAAKAVRIEQVRCRVGPAGNDELSAAVWLDLFNEYASEARLKAEIIELPDEWRVAPGSATDWTLGPLERRTVRVDLHGLSVPLSPCAKTRIPIRVPSGNAKPKDVQAVLPILVAPAVQSPIKADGVLNDWPIAAGNTAGEFRLAGRRGRGPKGFASRQTTAFVVRDGDSLCFAIRCHEPNMESLVARPDNMVRYDQLLAHGEDMVEILLDPGAKAKGPEDLYHIVVKANGVVLTEKGIGCDPPLGKCSPWPAGAAVAVGREKDAWVVELKIPLSAFGEAGKEKYWGLNIARFATRGDEASSWSEAYRYFYDPKNLGNMIVLPAVGR